jgi:hypothetical protein
MTADITDIRASRLRVARSRGAVGGVVLVLLGLWAALVPFIGPSFDLAYTPFPNDSWHWTAARAYLEVLPGAAAFLGGLLLVVSTSRLIASLGGWLATAGGAWLVVGSPLADVLHLHIGRPDPTSSSGTQAAAALLFFFGTGVAVVFFATVALGRLSVHSVRDVRVAQRRAAAEEAAAAEEQRLALKRAEDDRQAEDERRIAAERQATEPPAGEQPAAYQQPAGYQPPEAAQQPPEAAPQAQHWPRR